jgi:hypothetical protein
MQVAARHHSSSQQGGSQADAQHCPQSTAGYTSLHPRTYVQNWPAGRPGEAPHLASAESSIRPLAGWYARTFSVAASGLEAAEEGAGPGVGMSSPAAFAASLQTISSLFRHRITRRAPQRIECQRRGHQPQSRIAQEQLLGTSRGCQCWRGFACTACRSLH